MTAIQKPSVFAKYDTYKFFRRSLLQISIWRRHLTSALAFTLFGGILFQTTLAQAQTAYPAVIESLSAGGGEARIDVLGERFAQLPAVAAHQSRIVVYRPEDGRVGATSIFVNGRYHASLVPGAWCQLCYASGPVEIATRQMQAATRPAKDRYEAISALTLQGGQVHYLRVSDTNNLPVLRPVASAQALQELGASREQLHTVSRVAQTCVDVMPAPAVPVQTYTLPADTLFAFDRSDRAGMTDAGTRAIDLLLDRLGQDYSRIDRLHLIGHADPLGLPERNERLAIERAQTVRDYINATRSLQAPITAEGRSSREPVVRHCGRVATPQAIACNQPNRRVAVEVTGTRR
jgi:OOP family OmpA-OmpF porin